VSMTWREKCDYPHPVLAPWSNPTRRAAAAARAAAPAAAFPSVIAALRLSLCVIALLFTSPKPPSGVHPRHMRW